MIKDGKLFGKVNLFDAAVLLLIIALIIAGISKFKTFNETVDASALGSITYTITVYNVRDYTVDAFVSGDTVYDSGTNVSIGVIKNVEKRPAQAARTLADGSVKILENEHKNDMILTIETPGSATGEGYYANKSIELKVGSEKEIETRYATTYGKVTSINYNEGE